jgi:hypothetical protein
VLDSEIYEPAAAVPFPNSSSRIRDRAVEFRSARDTWLRSIIKDDCTLVLYSQSQLSVSSCPRKSKEFDFEIHFGDRLAGLNAGENWGANRN